MGATAPRFKRMRLLRIQLDDQVLVDVGQNVVPAGRRLEDAAELLVVHLDPLGQSHLLRDVERALDAQLLARLDRKSTRLNSSHITRSRMPSSA